MNEPLLLDTCAIIWLASNPGRFSPGTREAIERAAALWYCPISAWEVACKASRGMLGLPLPARSWFKRVTEHHGVDAVPLDEDILFLSAELPWLHRDPADRIIIATALRRNVAVVTGDGRFEAYGVRTME